MKILQVCHKVPHPPYDGGSIAMNNLTQGLLNEDNEVKVIAINTPDNYIAETDADSEYADKTQIETVYVDTSLKVWDAFFNLFTNKSYNIQRFVSEAFSKKLEQVLKSSDYDIVQLESLYVTPYMHIIRKYSTAKVVLRAHNVEFEIWERLANTCTNPLKKAYLGLLAKRLRRYETGLLNSYDAIASITQRDAGIFKQSGCTIPVINIPFGTDLANCEGKSNTTTPPSIFHLGSMDWRPNKEAIDWFLENVWERVNMKYPDLKFYIAGKGMPRHIINNRYHNLIVEGRIDDALDFMRSKTIMVVPLLSGSGIRIKIIEGMALGKTIISTSVGAEGIQYEHLKNILIANTPEEFVEMIGKCINNKELCDEIGNNARLLIKEHYNNRKIAGKLVDFYLSIL